MSELLYPMIEPEDYLKLATELSLRSDTVSQRTVADRAYYAAFLTSRDLLARKGYITPYYTAQDHKFVEETLKSKDILGAFGNEEFRLRQARNRINYDTRDLNREQESVRSIKWMLDTASKIIKKVNSLPNKS